jgi:uncharacterized protein
MPLALSPVLLLLASGAVVGVTLGLIGGGGSVLAVPLLIYVVGVPSTHVAIGTASVAVALNGASGLLSHARMGSVKWPCALVFATSGVAGALVGTHFGQKFGGTELLGLFGVFMVAVGAYMLLVRPTGGSEDVRLTTATAAQLLPRLISIGGIVGLLSGFFGIGGGFLIVPGLVLATGMALRNAIATSLFAVTAFGLTTAASYMAAGLVDWKLAGLIILGGIAGSLFGTRINASLAHHKAALSYSFASAIIGVGAYIVATAAL